MDFGGAMILLAGGLGVGAIWGVILSFINKLDGVPYGTALARGLKIGVVFGLTAFVALVALGLYENLTGR
jgi:hypothetical protein